MRITSERLLNRDVVLLTLQDRDWSVTRLVDALAFERQPNPRSVGEVWTMGIGANVISWGSPAVWPYAERLRV